MELEQQHCMSKDFITLSRAAFGDDDDGSDYDHDGDGAESVKRCLSDDSGVHDTYRVFFLTGPTL